MYSETIKTLRKQQGITQEQLAKALGISRSTVAMYEKGEREPNFEMCEAIADYFNCRLSDIIEKTPTEVGVSSRVNRLIKLLESLPDEALDKVYDYISLLSERYK